MNECFESRLKARLKTTRKLVSQRSQAERHKVSCLAPVTLYIQSLSKCKFESELDVTSRRDGRKRSVITIREIHFQPAAAVAAELDLVEGVEEIALELQPEPLGERELLAQ